MPQAFPLGLSPLFLAQNGFVSAQVARAGGVATPLWAVGLAAVNPAAGRTAGAISVVGTLEISNDTGGAVTVWLEVGGVVVTPLYHLNNTETAIVSFELGKVFGNQDINLNASANGVIAQIEGYQV